MFVIMFSVMRIVILNFYLIKIGRILAVYCDNVIKQESSVLVFFYIKQPNQTSMFMVLYSIKKEIV